MHVRSKSIVVPFGNKRSWKSMQALKCEAKAMKELEREMKEAVQKEREVRTVYLWVELNIGGWGKKK